MSKSMCFHVYDKTTTLSIPQPAKKNAKKRNKIQNIREHLHWRTYKFLFLRIGAYYAI